MMHVQLKQLILNLAGVYVNHFQHTGQKNTLMPPLLIKTGLKRMHACIHKQGNGVFSSGVAKGRGGTPRSGAGL